MNQMEYGITWNVLFPIHRPLLCRLVNHLPLHSTAFGPGRPHNSNILHSAHIVCAASSADDSAPNEESEANDVLLLNHATLTFMAMQKGLRGALDEMIDVAWVLYTKGVSIPAIKVVKYPLFFSNILVHFVI